MPFLSLAALTPAPSCAHNWACLPKTPFLPLSHVHSWACLPQTPFLSLPHVHSWACLHQPCLQCTDWEEAVPPTLLPGSWASSKYPAEGPTAPRGLCCAAGQVGQWRGGPATCSSCWGVGRQLLPITRREVGRRRGLWEDG